MKERWLIRLLVDRERQEGPPNEWDWPTLLDGGDPIVLMAKHVGMVPDDEEEEIRDSLTGDDDRDG